MLPSIVCASCLRKPSFKLPKKCWQRKAGWVRGLNKSRDENRRVRMRERFIDEPRTTRKTLNGFINCPSFVPSADVSCHAVHGKSGIRNLTYHQTRLAPSTIFLFNKPKSSSVPSDSPILLFKNFSPCPPSTPIKNRSPYLSFEPSRDSGSLVQSPSSYFVT